MLRLDLSVAVVLGGGPGRFTHAKTPGLAIPDNAAAISDAIAVPGFGTAASVSVSVYIAHPYIDDLTVELVAPDGTARRCTTVAAATRTASDRRTRQTLAAPRSRGTGPCA